MVQLLGAPFPPRPPVRKDGDGAALASGPTQTDVHVDAIISPLKPKKRKRKYRAPFFKGEADGHDFRGNQYTGGIDGPGSGDAAPSSARSSASASSPRGNQLGETRSPGDLPASEVGMRLTAFRDVKVGDVLASGQKVTKISFGSIAGFLYTGPNDSKRYDLDEPVQIRVSAQPAQRDPGLGSIVEQTTKIAQSVHERGGTNWRGEEVKPIVESPDINAAIATKIDINARTVDRLTREMATDPKLRAFADKYAKTIGLDDPNTAALTWQGIAGHDEHAFKMMQQKAQSEYEAAVDKWSDPLRAYMRSVGIEQNGIPSGVYMAETVRDVLENNMPNGDFTGLMMTGEEWKAPHYPTFEEAKKRYFALNLPEPPKRAVVTEVPLLQPQPDNATIALASKVRRTVDAWAGSSGDTTPISIALQRAVADHFGLSDADQAPLKTFASTDNKHDPLSVEPELRPYLDAGTTKNARDLKVGDRIFDGETVTKVTYYKKGDAFVNGEKYRSALAQEDQTIISTIDDKGMTHAGAYTFWDSDDNVPLDTRDLADSVPTNSSWNIAGRMLDDQRAFYDHFVQAVYDNTQAELKKAGATELLLYRGMHIDAPSLDETPANLIPPVKSYTRYGSVGGDERYTLRFTAADDRSVAQQPLSSWSADKDIAKRFSQYGSGKGLLLSTVVPAARVFSLASGTGVGCLEEREVVVIGGPGQAHATWNSEGSWSQGTVGAAKFAELDTSNARDATPKPGDPDPVTDWLNANADKLPKTLKGPNVADYEVGMYVMPSKKITDIHHYESDVDNYSVIKWVDTYTGETGQYLTDGDGYFKPLEQDKQAAKFKAKVAKARPEPEPIAVDVPLVNADWIKHRSRDVSSDGTRITPVVHRMRAPTVSFIKAGEAAGHAFRGNQYETGTGGTTAPVAPPDARAAAIAAEARAEEPAVSAAMADVARAAGGSLGSFEFRLKTPASLTRKLAAGKDVTDALRYTIVLPKETYGAAMGLAFTKLRQLGYRLDPADMENYWPAGDTYNGMNTLITPPGSQRKIELQYHTPESFAAKMTNHPDYEAFRSLPPGAPERKSLFDRQRHLADAQTAPFGARAFPQLKLRPFTKRFSFVKVGEAAGHAFRGNQYISGQSGGDGATSDEGGSLAPTTSPPSSAVHAGAQAPAQGGREVVPITAADTQGRGRAVSLEEFHALAREGQAQLAAMAEHASPHVLADPKQLAVHIAAAYAAATKSWGGVTIDAHTGTTIPDGAMRYAVTTKPPGMKTVALDEHASRAQFAHAYKIALSRFSSELDHAQAHLGVFHDDDKHRIDIDPVTVVDNLHDVETIGAASHAIGGAYCFADGNGYFPPHIADAELGAKVIPLHKPPAPTTPAIHKPLALVKGGAARVSHAQFRAQRPDADDVDLLPLELLDDDEDNASVPLIPVEPLAKAGEGPDHPFRGNQYEEGQSDPDDPGALLSPHALAPEPARGRAGARPDNPHATELDHLTPELAAAITAKVLKNSPDPAHPLTPEVVQANLMSMYKEAVASDAAAVVEGKSWYNVAKTKSLAFGHDTHIGARAAIGMTAALSPQAYWEENIAMAALVARKLVTDAPLDLTPEQLAKVNHDVMASRGGKLQHMIGFTPLKIGMKLSEMTPGQAAAAIKAMSQRDVDTVEGTTTATGEPRKFSWSTGLGNVTKAVQIFRGEDPDAVLAGHKVRSFFNNIADPNNDQHRDDVTIDTHAVSAAAHARIAATSPVLDALFSSGLSNKAENTLGTYAYFADAYRQAAAATGLTPNQFQAVVWIHWRHLGNDSRFPDYEGANKPKAKPKKKMKKYFDTITLWKP